MVDDGPDLGDDGPDKGGAETGGLSTKIIVWGTVIIALGTLGILGLTYLIYSHPSPISPKSPVVAGRSSASSPAATATPPPTTSQKPQGSNLGDVNFAKYCMSMGDSLKLVSDNAYGWKCLSGTTATGIAVQGACSSQYGSGATGAKLMNFDDPFSWYCYRQ